MSTKRKFTIGGLATLVLVLMMVIPWTVFADQIYNNLDGTIDSTAEVMPLNVGGANGTTTLYVSSTNGDGKNGCNLTGATTLVVSVNSSDTSIATVSPSSITFTSCGFTKLLTVTPHNQGSATISLSQTSNNSGGTFDLTPATFTVNVAPPANTAPQVSISGITAGASYDNDSVPAAMCDIVDAEDGNSSFAASLSAITGPYASDGIGSQTASCSYTDGGGLTASASVTYDIVDPSAPGISYALVPSSPDGANGWYTSNVSLTWTVAENESPSSLVKTDCVDQNITADQQEQSYSCSATSAGGSAGPVTVTIKRDATAPEISASLDKSAAETGWYNITTGAPTVSFSCSDATSGLAAPCPDAYTFSEGADQSYSKTIFDNASNSNSAGVSGINVDLTAPSLSGMPTTSPNGNGWYKTDVTIQWTCVETLSGIVSCPANSTISTQGTNQTDHKSVSDNAGNTTDADSSPAVNIDKTAPSVSLIGGPADGGSYFFGFVPAAPTCSATDSLSGLDGSCNVSGYSNAIGSHTVTATATDKAGNSSSTSATYTVSAWMLSGFYQPVDMNGVLNTVKNGATVPLKFEVFAGSTELVNTSVVTSLKSAKVNCDGTAPTDDVELTATGGTSLRYDTTAGQFVYNWQTPKTAGVCYNVTVTMQDGSSLSALFKLK